MKILSLLILCLSFGFQAMSGEITTAWSDVDYPDFIEKSSDYLGWTAMVYDARIDPNMNLVPNPKTRQDVLDEYIQDKLFSPYNGQIEKEDLEGKPARIDSQKMGRDDITLSSVSGDTVIAGDSEYK